MGGVKQDTKAKKDKLLKVEMWNYLMMVVFIGF